ncbi:hypothetical protein RHSIM_Rhsim10G0104400 [Rhododendron simsii]|uniref:AB hydrolase-1 domain-containing protein n=1 Tax=Rhododendron simsii TaxID=118357 RepID=A0A834GCI0_RHOSS|nr:hypothetical protein RHSIM_Rhsim10G0104400 [Rhododendron simsii]
MGMIEEVHNAKVLGSGQKTVVLAHGFGTDQSVWRHLVPHLVDNSRVVLFDFVGAGTTNLDYFDFERYSTLEGYALDFLAILVELKVESCVFVGHSSSDMARLLASVIRPDLFHKLIMLTASLRFLNDVDYCGGFEQEDINQLLQADAYIYLVERALYKMQGWKCSQMSQGGKEIMIKRALQSLCDFSEVRIPPSIRTNNPSFEDSHSHWRALDQGCCRDP